MYLNNYCFHKILIIGEFIETCVYVVDFLSLKLRHFT